MIMSQLKRLVLVMEYIIKVTDKEKPFHRTGVIHANHIADRLGFSIRTIYRDIEYLQNADIPVSYDLKRGYVLSREQLNYMILVGLKLRKDSNNGN